AQDAFNNTNGSYAGTVSLSSSDGQFVPPSSQALVAGTTTFSSNVILKTAGTQTVSAADGVNSGTSSSITVNPAAANHLTVTAPGAATAGPAFTVTVPALHQLNHPGT